VGRQEFNYTIEVFGAKSLRGTSHRYLLVVFAALLLFGESLMNHLRVDDGARVIEDSKVTLEHIIRRLPKRASVDTNVGELIRRPTKRTLV
jgi:hypothetical protein